MTGRGLTARQSAVKRSLDLGASVVGMLLSWPVMLAAWLVATVETRRNGLYCQRRIGRDGQPFYVMKIRTMKPVGGTTVTTSSDTRITRSGAIMRRLKIDELPQLINVLRGEMSLVGPRPDVPGFADRLIGADRVILSVRPGITGPAALAYRHEEEILARVADPEGYNRDVIWPDKVRINREYVERWSLMADISCVVDTVRSVFARAEGDHR